MKLLDKEQALDKEPTLEQERTLDEQFAEITRHVEPRREVTPLDATRRRFGWRSRLAVALIFAAIAAIAIAVVATRGDDTATEPATATEVGQTTATPVVVESNWPFTEEEIDLMRLARAGYIPREAVDWELMELKELVLRGVIPAETLVTPPRPLPVSAQRNPEIAEQRELLELYRANQIPREAVDWQLLELVDLVNLRHVPVESLYVAP